MAKWIEVEKEKLIQAIKVLEIVPLRSGIPSSDYVSIIPEKKYMELALASSVSAVVRVDWKNLVTDNARMFIDRRLLIPFVMTGEKWKGNFQFSFQEGLLKVKQGSRQAELGLRTDAVNGYGSWRNLEGMKELKITEELRQLLIASNACSTADPALQHLNCVYVGGDFVVATNQTVMFLGTNKGKSKVKIPFPVGIIPLLGQGLVKGVIIEDSLVILDCECGYIQGTVSAVAQKEFPHQVIMKQMEKARTAPLLGKIPAGKLAKMLKRLSDYLVGVKREDWQLKLEFGEGKLKAKVRIRQGVFEEKLEVEGLTKEAEVEWPLELVRPVLDYMGENTEWVKVRVDEDKKTPYLISGGGVELLVARRA